MRIVVGIPVRMGSTRFPGKPLCDILGKTMIEHCYKRCALSKHTTDLFVAACDSEIKEEVENFGVPQARILVKKLYVLKFI